MKFVVHLKTLTYLGLESRSCTVWIEPIDVFAPPNFICAIYSMRLLRCESQIYSSEVFFLALSWFLTRASNSFYSKLLRLSLSEKMLMVRIYNCNWNSICIKRRLKSSSYSHFLKADFCKRRSSTKKTECPIFSRLKWLNFFKKEECAVYKSCLF